MHTMDAILSRRSIKHFDPKHEMPDTEFDQLINAAMAAPTSFNIQHWRFVRVTDKHLRQSLRQVAWDQAQMTDASELLIITGNTSAWEQQPERYWRNTDTEKRNALVAMMNDFYQGRDWLQRDEAIRSGAMAAQNLMLAAKDLGYDTSPMIGFDIDAVGKLINLPDDHVIVMMLAIGKGTSKAWPRGGQLASKEVVVTNEFDAPPKP